MDDVRVTLKQTAMMWTCSALCQTGMIFIHSRVREGLVGLE